MLRKVSLAHVRCTTAVTAMYEKKQCRLGWRAYVAADVAEVPKDDHVAKTVNKADAL